jgi:hypothetical protein
MQNDYRNPKSLSERPGPAGRHGKNWYPEVIEPEDVGRSYPETEPLSLRAVLRKLIAR